ncbi:MULTISPECIES: DUF1122 family protein [Pyrobaculum]|uniref:DUF1122 domain-containing protein n=2 Tax=Pyrobaculum arsenaticum TaxID=121277 RepID=A4WHP1_PYRAR|nr:DUF1122 family protein [Pyrobaculum arsenaticum]ABP49908.1 conserved hypothetical protein [Pyrobaculum arsenaticum DSM 13514]NYR15893.1 DUF1122 family protein [Pyrobaculum arsenaticum]
MLRDIAPNSFAPLTAVFKRGRFKEELNAELFLGSDLLCCVKLFLGRPPYYTPWAEVFHFNPAYLETEWERHVYCVLSRYMEPGDVLYAEYVEDRETFAALQRGAAPGETRLGKLLEQCGFKVVRDWYYPEGWLEGGMKLQAVKLR